MISPPPLFALTRYGILLVTLLLCTTPLKTIAEESLSDGLGDSSVIAQLVEGQAMGNRGTLVINLRGNISKNMLQKIQESIGSSNDDALPAGVIVLLNSPGGDGGAAIQIGRLLRQANAHVFVTGHCASACVFVLAGGVVRSALPYTLGVHHGRITVSDKNAKVLRELSAEDNPTLSNILNLFEQDASRYLDEMGIPPAFFENMQAYSPKEVRWLSEYEIFIYGFNEIDPVYFNQYLSWYKENSKGQRVEENKLSARMKIVLTKCRALDDFPKEFLECYKKTLSTAKLN